MKCTTVQTKITKIRPNLTHFFATLTNTQGFTKKKKCFWQNDKNKQKFKRFLTKIPKIRPNLTYLFCQANEHLRIYQERKPKNAISYHYNTTTTTTPILLLQYYYYYYYNTTTTILLVGLG